MRYLRLVSVGILCVLLGATGAFATNGTNLIGIGPISRAMGGTGIAAPQDAISAVFANPAAMCFGPYCPGSEFNFASTLFMPKVDTKISVSDANLGGMFGGMLSGEFKADSDEKVYMIPAIGVSVPLTRNFPLWRFGMAAYGVSGLGVDYRDTDIERMHYPDPSSGAMTPAFPLVAGEYTQLQIMKVSPAIAYQPNERFSVGLALQVNYSALDLRQGSSFNYGFGVHVGGLVKVSDAITIGATYQSPNKVSHENVRDFDQMDGVADDLDLESPQQVGVGVAFHPGNFLLEVDGKWVNWSGAEGYETFDWNDQWTIGVGAQYELNEKITFRVGYNYGENPVEEHSNFVGNTGSPIPPMVSIQGKDVPSWYYEAFRIVGFPAIVQHHISFGVGFKISDTWSLELAYMHAIEESIEQSGTDIAGQAATIESTLSEDSVDFSLTWRF